LGTVDAIRKPVTDSLVAVEVGIGNTG